MALIDNLISFWELEAASGAESDSVGTNTLDNNGGADNYPGSAAGKVNNCRDFTPGSFQCLSSASNTSLQTGDIDFTYAGWVQFDALADWQSVGGKTTASNVGGEYSIRTVSSQFLLLVRNAADTADANVAATTFGTLSTGTWYFVVAWHDATNNQIGIAINGGAADTAAHAGGVFAGSARFALGGISATGNYLDGRIDQVGFWKRVLTSDERAWLYNAGAGRTYAAISAGMGGSAALTGTATDNITEADIVAGSETLIITLTGDTFISN